MFPTDGYWVCKRCGEKIPIDTANSTVVRETKEERELLIIDEQTDTLPKTKVECPACHNNEAYWVIRQTRAADEPETRIYRCTKCGHTWREYA